MRKFCLFILIFTIMISCTNKNTNPLLEEFDTPFGTPPFEKIKFEHYMPAFQEGLKKEKLEIEVISSNSDEPTFDNTIVEFDKAGRLLDKVSSVFYRINSANTNDQMQKLTKELSPILSKHNDDIYLNEKLFARIKKVYDQKDEFELNIEQKTLLEKIYKKFVRSGADLDSAGKERLREINKNLSELSLKFGQNILKEDNGFHLVIDNKDDLEGLPENVISGANSDSKKLGYGDKWVFTLHKPSWIPFLQFSKKRDLREKLYSAYINRGNNNNEFDNKETLLKIINLRIERAQLLGYERHADYILENNMAKTPERVFEFFDQLWKPALKMAKKEAADLQKSIYKEGNKFKLQPWDWWYYTQKLKKERYDINDEELRPYFKIENVMQGAFTVANKLYGITVNERHDISVYHEDVKVFEMKDQDGSHMGIFYVDYFPRESKRGGAWSSSFRSQSKVYGEKITPIIYNVCNFSKPTGDNPALLTFDEAQTLFHEFGHALHSFFNNTTYNNVRRVPRDFVEMPSQVMENWAGHPDVIKLYAKHYKTGEPIPQKLLDKFISSTLFNEGFRTVEYLAATYLDMKWHTLSKPTNVDVLKFEKNTLDGIGLIPEIISRYRTTYFNHIFNSGYSAGYYSYVWSQVIDADVFEAFKETGDIFNQQVASDFRYKLLAKGGSSEGMELYKNFRGKEPSVEPLLKRRGLK